MIERKGLATTDQITEELKEFADEYKLETYGLKLEKIEQLPIGDMNLIPGIKMVAIDGDGLPIKEGELEAAIISYTIVKFKEGLR